MTEDLRPPYRIQFDNARDPYTARNALGITGTGGSGGGAPVDAEYIVAVDDPTLTNDRVLTNTATVTWDLTTPGQVKANTVIGGGPFQPLDADLTAIAALTGTNDIYYRSAANTWTSVAVGTGLTFTGGTLAASGAGGGVTRCVTQVFTASGTYTPSSGLKFAIFECVGGGGGGGGISLSAAGSVYSGGGGGSSGYSRATISAATIGASKTVTIGAVGAAGTAGGVGGSGAQTFVGGQTVTITIASPAVISWTGHGLIAGQSIFLTTTGALPTGLAITTRYFVMAAGLTANAFQVSATSGGAAINTSGSQSGTHTASFILANGGGGGNGSTNGSAFSVGGTGGAAGVGDFVAPGINGQGGMYSSVASVILNIGAGAPSYFGGSGAATVAGGGAGSNGNNATGYGAGGSGGMITNATGSVIGGTGSAGVCIITEFCT